MKKTLSKKLDTRFLDLIDETDDSQTDQMTFSFSSETPVKRNGFNEILDHSVESVNLDRLKRDAPLLFNHDMDKPIGRVKNAWVENNRGRATIQWGTSDLAKQVRNDVEIGVLRNISVGYTIEESEEDKDGNIRATRWTGHELSVVTIPADTSIGIGRSLPTNKPLNERIMPEHQINSADYLYESKPDELEKESRQFSVIKAVQSLASGRGLQGREAEITREIEIQTNKRTQGFFVPNTGWSNTQKRTYVTSSSSAGGDLVATQKMPDEFIDILRNKLAVTSLGARTLTGMPKGNIEIPRRTASGGAAFFGGDDADSISETTGSFDTISLTPHPLASYQKFSHLMELQALPEIEELIRADMVEKLAQEIDIAAIAGTGSGSTPRGILFTTGIGSVSGGTNGLAPTIDNLIDLKAEVGIDSGDANTGAFLTNSKVEKVLSKLKDSQNNYLLNPYTSNLGDAQVCGRRMFVSNNVPSDLTKGSSSGVCSAILYGDFSQLMVAVFSELEVLIDPFTDFSKATTGIRAITSIDIGIRQPSAFAAMQDALTA